MPQTVVLFLFAAKRREPSGRLGISPIRIVHVDRVLLVTVFRHDTNSAGTARTAAAFFFGPTAWPATLLEQFCETTCLNRFAENLREGLKVTGQGFVRRADKMKVERLSIHEWFDLQQAILAIDFLQIVLAVVKGG